VLVDESGSVRVVDFGIARGTAADERLAFTRTGQVVGTPRYMRPQQGMGVIDRRVDIYSAGVILYELLCGRAPFGGQSTMEVLLRAATEAPAPPSRVAETAVDPELDRICLRAIARDPSDRYETASAFADDLARWLRKQAKRLDPRHGARRHLFPFPAATLAVAASAAFLVLAVLLMAFLNRSPSVAPDGGQGTAGVIPNQGQPAAPNALPTKEARTLRGHRGQVVRVAFSPDGGTLASSGIDGTVILWDSATGVRKSSLRGHQTGWVRGLAWSRQGDLLASGGQKDLTIRFWDPVSGRQLRQFANAHAKGVACLYFHPSGKRLASAGEDGIRIWDLARGAVSRTLSGHEQLLLSIAFSPDGRYLASGSLDHTIRMWEVESGKQVWSLRPGCQWAGDCVAFSPDGRLVASEREDKVLALWAASSGECLRVFAGHEDHLNAIAFGPGGSWLATGSSDQTIRIWCSATGRCLHVLRGHRGWVRSVDVSPDGLRLASGGADGTVRIWELPGAPAAGGSAQSP
jgi:WD40 repeat protein